MKFKYSLLTLLLLLSSCSWTVKKDISLKEKVNEFLTILIQKDEQTLVSKYASGSASFSQNGKLNPDIYRFLYENKDENYRPVTNIVDQDDYYIKVIPQANGSYIALFTKNKYKEQASSTYFLENEWMKKYFACEFELVEGELSFKHNICFAETGGPFQSEYDF